MACHRYGYFNPKLTHYRGLQWRFHPHACPTTPREYPFGYAAVAASSWIRDSCCQDDWLNSQSLIIDYIEKGHSDWYNALGDTRSFAERLFDPADVSLPSPSPPPPLSFPPPPPPLSLSTPAPPNTCPAWHPAVLQPIVSANTELCAAISSTQCPADIACWHRLSAGRRMSESWERGMDPRGEALPDARKDPGEGQHKGLLRFWGASLSVCFVNGSPLDGCCAVHRHVERRVSFLLSEPHRLCLQTKFKWRMEFNGWVAEQEDEWEHDRVPEQIDSIVIGYTNQRSFTKLQLKQV